MHCMSIAETVREMEDGGWDRHRSPGWSNLMDGHRERPNLGEIVVSLNNFVDYS